MAFRSNKHFCSWFFTGVITCNVSDGYKHSAKSIDVQVIGKPVVFISPPTKVVNQGESVTIECRITSVHSVMTSIIWYKDGLIFSGSQGKSIFFEFDCLFV